MELVNQFLLLSQKDPGNLCAPPTCLWLEYYFSKLLRQGLYDAEDCSFTLENYGNVPLARFYKAPIMGVKHWDSEAPDTFSSLMLVKNPDRSREQQIGLRNSLIVYKEFTFACSISKGAVTVDRPVISKYQDDEYQKDFTVRLSHYLSIINPDNLAEFTSRRTLAVAV
jgi:hypothetical protein